MSIGSLTASTTVSDPLRLQLQKPVDEAIGARQKAASQAAPAPNQGEDPAHIEHPNMATEQVQQLIGMVGSWGSTDATFDLSGDGVVNVQDFLLILQGLHGTNAPAIELPAEEAASEVPQPAGPTRSGVAADATRPAPLAVDPASATVRAQQDVGAGVVAEGVRPAPSTRAQKYAAANLIVDGVRQPLAPRAQKQAEVGATADGVRNRMSPGVQKLKLALLDGLAAAGFKHRPPSNIRDLVDRLDVSKADRRNLLADLRAHYPRGLGVNLQG